MPFGTTRGRVYEERNPKPQPAKSGGPGGQMFPNAEARLDMVVTRADGTVEHYSHPATLEELKDG